MKHTQKKIGMVNWSAEHDLYTASPTAWIALMKAGREQMIRVILADQRCDILTSFFDGIISELDTAGEPPGGKRLDEAIEQKASAWFEHEAPHRAIASAGQYAWQQP